jgi:hypothetical protein
MSLASQGHVPIGQRWRIGIFALRRQSTDLCSQIGELIITLPSRMHRADGCQGRPQY